MKTSKKIAKKIYKLFDDKSKWIKGAFAKNKNGNVVLAVEETATQFCLVGASRHLAPVECDAFREDFRNYLQTTHGVGSIVEFNDDKDTTYRKMRTALRTFINSK